MIEYTAEMAHATAARGAVWLDEKCPDWPARIDLEVLKLSDAEFCILGQTATCILGPAGPRDEGRDGFWRVFNAVGWKYGGDRQKELGFDVPYGGTFAEGEARYEMLTIAWRELIRERLAVPA